MLNKFTKAGSFSLDSELRIFTWSPLSRAQTEISSFVQTRLGLVSRFPRRGRGRDHANTCEVTADYFWRYGRSREIFRHCGRYIFQYRRESVRCLLRKNRIFKGPDVFEASKRGARGIGGVDIFTSFERILRFTCASLWECRCYDKIL